MATLVTDEMVAAFKTAAFNRMMGDDGCPEGEATRAGLEAIAPMIRDAALEEAAKALEQRHTHPKAAALTSLTTIRDAEHIRSLKTTQTA